MCTFLTSDVASGISGEILYVDGGFNTTAMGSLEKWLTLTTEIFSSKYCCKSLSSAIVFC